MMPSLRQELDLDVSSISDSPLLVCRRVSDGDSFYWPIVVPSGVTRYPMGRGQSFENPFFALNSFFFECIFRSREP